MSGLLYPVPWWGGRESLLRPNLLLLPPGLPPDGFGAERLVKVIREGNEGASDFLLSWKKNNLPLNPCVCSSAPPSRFMLSPGRRE